MKLERGTVVHSPDIGQVTTTELVNVDHGLELFLGLGSAP
jgi:hypothetical protein